MKSDGNLLVKSFLSGLIAALILFAPAAVKAQADLQKAIDRHIKKVIGDAAEYKEARKIVFGDVNGDGTKDAVVQYTLEGFGGGNSWGRSIAVFLNRKGVYKIAADETVGGKFSRVFKLLKVNGKEIIGATETCPDGDPQGICADPKKERVKYVLLNGKLKGK